MTKIAHIIHPGIVEPSSDLVIAQPITFETMRTAREFVGKAADVMLCAVQYHDEERVPLPGCFVRTPDINRSIADIRPFKIKRKLALIKDILDSLYEVSQADYFIYTNVDIALQPYFYRVVSVFIEQGYDSFIINRRSIPERYKHKDEIALMYSEVGEKHPGWDCFVFKRNLYPQFYLGNTCIGADWIGRVMITNLACLSKRFEVFTDLHATFHIGTKMVWRSQKLVDYGEHNKNECKKILIEFEKKYGPFDRKTFPGRFFKLLENDR